MTEILYRTQGDHVAVVTLNRPEKRNAVNGAMASSLGELVARTEADPAIRAVVLASSDPAIFCAGADLAEIARGNGRQLWTEAGGFAGITSAIRHKPWIAAITGPALAGGCEIALCCDMIVASDGASFGLPEVKRGLYAAAGGAVRLPRAVPRNIALEILATGDPLTAGRAHALGLVNHLVDTDAALTAALDLAARIAANAPVSVVESLKLARRALDDPAADLAALSAAAGKVVMRTDDAREGPRAFVERRPPVWTGR